MNDPTTEPTLAQHQNPDAGTYITLAPGTIEAPEGHLVRCTDCSAERDWLLVYQARRVWIFCRCSEYRHTPEISGLQYNVIAAKSPLEDKRWPDLRTAVAMLGFDGTLRGTYLP